MQDQPIENLSNNTNVSADSMLLVLKNGVLTKATINDVLANSELNNNLNHLVHLKTGVVTTDSTGNISLGKSSSNIIVLNAYVSGYNVRTFVNSYNWFLKVVNIETNEPLSNVSVGYTYLYVNRADTTKDA